MNFSVLETDWSIQMADIIVTTEWICPNCDGSFHINGIQRLQHKKGDNTAYILSILFNNIRH